jgi:hypothetical protein
MMEFIANVESALTPVNLLMAGLSSVTGVLGVAVKQLFSRLIKAEDKIDKMQFKIDELTASEAEAHAKVQIYEQCSKRHTRECPFAIHINQDK